MHLNDNNNTRIFCVGGVFFEEYTVFGISLKITIEIYGTILYNILYNAKRKGFCMLSAFKNFGVTFLIAAIIFGVVAYFAVGFVLNTVDSIMEDEKDELDSIIQQPDDADETADPELVDPNDKEPEGESFDFLVITTDYRPDIYDDYLPSLDDINKENWNEVEYEETAGFLAEKYRRKSASSIIFVRVDKENHRYIYSYISTQIRVYTSSGYRTLAEVYEYYGKQALADHVNSLTGLKPEYTVLINGYNLDELAELLGNVTTTVDRDIYSDGMYYSMQYETTHITTTSGGDEKIEHIPNTFVMAKGEVTTNAEILYGLLSVKEHSLSDLKAKESYCIDILMKYLGSLGAMEKDDQKILLAKLITKRSDWGNIEGLGETVVVEPDTSAETNPETETDDVADTGAPWNTLLGEPEDAIIETNYTMNDFDDITELLSAISDFESITVTYPCTYVAETAESSDYFSASYESALDLYAPYKVIPEIQDK